MNSGYNELRKELVQRLINEGIITSKKVAKAMSTVPRELFVPGKYKELAYMDHPLPIGWGQTISAPHMVAMMTEALDPEPGNIVLEIGAGSGYHAAVVAEIICHGPKYGHVFTIERIAPLAAFAQRNLVKAGYGDCVTVIVGDGSGGVPELAPFDRILITAAAPTIPKVLLNQLAVGGRIVAPVGHMWEQRLVIVKRISKDKIKYEYGTYCVFVPLIGKYGWREDRSRYSI
ncbi:MAG: protein-L-isoaspartate O-methyltransferase [Thermoprotei archaeon]|nr:MAG: protein-L-isoaspartate O-methyltransferase [Thermoprotei archaeon]